MSPNDLLHRTLVDSTSAQQLNRLHHLNLTPLLDFAKEDEIPRRLSTTADQSLDLAGMDVAHNGHGGEHQQRIEDVKIPLPRQDVAAVSLSILDEAHNRSDEDEDADAVQAPHVFLIRQALALECRCFADAEVEDGACDDEKAEDDYLQGETDEDEVFAGPDAVAACCE